MTIIREKQSRIIVIYLKIWPKLARTCNLSYVPESCLQNIWDCGLSNCPQIVRGAQQLQVWRFWTRREIFFSWKRGICRAESCEQLSQTSAQFSWWVNKTSAVELILSPWNVLSQKHNFLCDCNFDCKVIENYGI